MGEKKQGDQLLTYEAMAPGSIAVIIPAARASRTLRSSSSARAACASCLLQAQTSYNATSGSSRPRSRPGRTTTTRVSSYPPLSPTTHSLTGVRSSCDRPRGSRGSQMHTYAIAASSWAASSFQYTSTAHHLVAHLLCSCSAEDTQDVDS
ncbi:hypothetical protein B0H21DRAFT_717317 [Amylocystis lapponica]|nr:hypothetical protein B0H21DRAFT_717317 [Amylocystis lapponica]